MSLNAIPINAYADLGDAWVRYQTARIHQKYLQFGLHFHLDIDALMVRASRAAREARGTVAQARESAPADHMRRAMIEAIEHCTQLQTHSSARIAEVLVD